MVITNDGDFIYDGKDFIEYLNFRGFDCEDIAELVYSFLDQYMHDARFEAFYKTVEDEIHNNYAGDEVILRGDDLYIAMERYTETCNALQEVADSLREKSGKGNTRNDLAKEIETIVSNMGGDLIY